MFKNIFVTIFLALLAFPAVSFSATAAQLKVTADSLRAATAAADSVYSAALNTEGAARCSTTVKAYMNANASDARDKYNLSVSPVKTDSMYIYLKADKSAEMFLVTQTVQAQGLYTSVVDDGSHYIALVRKDKALQGIMLMQGVATGQF